MNIASISRRLLALPALATVMVASSPHATAKLRIVTTTPAIASIASTIGGKYVSVQALKRGKQDVHHVRPKPSFIIKMRKADIFIQSGLDGEPWVPGLLRTSRNERLLVGQPGNVDVSRGIHLLEVPARGTLSRAQGDIHVFGNPHYLIDPMNGIIVAGTIANALNRADPSHASEFDANLAKFTHDVKALSDRLDAKMAPYADQPIVVYHRSWPYFRARYHLVKIGEVEPKPGISPGPGHITKLVAKMKAQGAKVVIFEQYNPKNVANRVASRAGGVAVQLSTDVKGIKGADDYLSYIETNVNRLVEAFEKAGVATQAKGD